MNPRTACRSRAGSTLLELMVTLALLSATAGSLLLLGRAGTRLFTTGVSRAQLESSARRGLDQLARELTSARAGSLAALPESPLWLDAISFDQAAAIRAGDGRITWSTNVAEFRHEPSELDNGLDDDGDELVDEGLAVLVLDSGGAEERTLVLARRVREFLEGELENGLDDNGNGLVDERGLSFERVGADLRLHLTLEGRDPEHRLVTRTLTTTTWSRN
jgi:hypothetical protein